jgi:hypothetical protein
MTMVELLLQAERALSVGMVDQAEAIYRRVAAADPRNAIALVGLARVALERADDRGAYVQAWQARAIDPENAAAQRLVERLEEVFAHRGEALPPVSDGMPGPQGGPAPDPDPAPSARPAVRVPRPRRSLLARLLSRGDRS